MLKWYSLPMVMLVGVRLGQDLCAAPGVDAPAERLKDTSPLYRFEIHVSHISRPC